MLFCIAMIVLNSEIKTAVKVEADFYRYDAYYQEIPLQEKITGKVEFLVNNPI